MNKTGPLSRLHMGLKSTDSQVNTVEAHTRDYKINVRFSE